MSASSVPREDSQEPQRVSVSPLATPNMSPAATQPPQQQPVKAAAMMTSPIMNSGTTPRLLFTWDPYRNVSSSPGNTSAVTGGAVAKPPEEEVVEEGRLASSIDGCSTTSSVNNTNTGAETSAGVNSATRGTSNSVAPSSVATPGGARPPLTISALLGGAGYPNRGSPQLSATTVSLSQQQQMLHQSPNSEACVAPGSSHSTPSGPVLKRISTSAKDGRQYFLDYSPSPASNSGAPAALAAGGMPNLMLPPNMSPMTTVTSPPAPALSQQRHQPPGGMELLDSDGNSSTNISPQAVPLMSPPRSSSSNAGAYPSYGAVAAANSHSILSATPLPPMSGMAQHNPYRTPSIFYATAHSTSPATQQQQQQQQQQHVLHHQDIDDNDADLVYALESDPSAFIVRLLPPPPPLPELARVLTVPGVVQSLCARWCTYVAAVLKSDAFAAITAAPPPPPSSVTMSREGSNGSTKEELAAWYETAVDWWEKLDQEGTGAVDVRAKSRTVAAAVEVVASGRSRRQPSQNTSGSANGGRYNPQGGLGASGYRGRGGRGYHAGMGTYGYAASTTGHRGGAHPRGGAAAAAAAVGGMATGAHNTGAAATGYRGGRGSGGGSGYSYDAAMSGGDNQHDIPDEVDPAMHCNTAYYPSSNFNPYAESWHFSGTTGMATGAQQQQQPQQMQSSYTKGARPSQQLQQQQRGYGAMNM
ncbi:hypothetical protein, unknown function [Leishmania infantum JPCM5]|uniref:Uncharacterized protein n=2 Tax=Leishmania infantum TaxID=5671 RepID=A4HWG3_LEIIN|nr:hypothetical protein, unknown function [Leishmania infantum JPCM5]CAC9472202.1 hypothetical_protein_-_conserved [Leishmania infantum]CAM66789.1 hypothetical protein, unknown function [Leishmania infantum JPCM5]SUZ40481.1 hypothetical_protein_-_conserved [Leishmania infantum]|eukprot:XP_001464404.1 hypothetical protein, unknown function [Leishmania infantum JPCM5]